MLTPSGWLSLIVSLVALLVGRVLVLAEVVILGAVGLLLVAASVLAVWMFCPKTRIRRHHPSAVVSAVGDTEVGIEFEKRFWPPVKLPMHVQDTLKHYRPGAENGKLPKGEKRRGEDYERFTVSFNLSGKSKSVAYSFSPARRGIVSFGPLTVRASDPFGIARRKWKETAATEILVLPPIEDVIPPLLSLLAKSQEEEVCSIWQGFPSGDFLTLREYVHGDDLRQVHWKSTARTGQLMIRQSEHRRDSGALLLLDTRAESASEQDFEKMVGAAASLCIACRKHKMLLHVATPHMEPLLVRDDASLEEVLRMLALVPQSAEAELAQDFKEHRAVVILTGDRPGSVMNYEGFTDGFEESSVDSMAGLRVCFGEQPSVASAMWVPVGAKFSDAWNSYFWESHLSYTEAQSAGLPR